MPRIRLLPTAVALAIVVLCALPGNFAAASPAEKGPAIAASPSSTLPIGLAINASAIELNSSFWGTTLSAHPSLFPNVSSIIGATPASYVVWPGANEGDDYDYQTGLIWANDNTALSANTTEAQFASWCQSTGCHAIVEVPGVTDDPGFAAQEVRYTEHTLGLHPAFWEIGNEPGFWNHWNQSWGNWTYAVPGPTAMQYAEEVRNYTQAMRAVDPTLRLIGLPAVGRTGTGQSADAWIDDIIHLDGPNLSAVAVHIYPDLSTTLSTLPQYFATLTLGNGQSIPSRVPKLRAEIAAAAAETPNCGCASVPLLFTELGSAITGHPDGSAYSVGFPGALYIAAEITQAMDFNITNVDAYATELNTVNSWYDTSGNFRPEYTLYSTILPYLGPTVHTVKITGSSGDVYAIATVNHSAGGVEALMVVNADTTSSISFTPELPGGLRDASTEIRSWVDDSTPAPVSSYSSTLPANYVLPPQSLVLFESDPGPAEPVRFSEAGLPADARWFLSVDGHVQTSTSANFSLLLSPGTHTLASAAPIAVPNEVQHARWMPFPASTFVVGLGPVNLSVPFSLEYSVSLSEIPAGSGSVGPPQIWVRSGSPYTLAATAASGFVFVRWQGGGPGNYSGSTVNGSITPTGPDRETALFAPGFGQPFAERGLPGGEAWSITVRNQTFSSPSAAQMVVERNGTYAYEISPVSGYTPHPASGTFTAGGASQTLIEVDFVSPLFPVEFEESGLPSGSSWSIVVDNHTADPTMGNTSVLHLYLANGQYGYRIPAVGEYSVDPQGGSFLVAGASPPVMTVTFAVLGSSGGNPTFDIRIHEQGLPAGSQWTITISAGIADPVYWSSSTDNLTVTEPNGSYSYQAESVLGYLPSPASGTVVVNGSGGPFVGITFRLGSASAGVIQLPGLWTEVFRATIVAAVIGLTGFATFGTLYWRRRRPPAVSPPTPPSGASGYPMTPPTSSQGWSDEAAPSPTDLHGGDRSGAG